MRQLDLSIVIPAYNEVARLEPTIREMVDYFRARGTSVEIIVVDDGSRDATSGVAVMLAEECSMVKLIRLPANRGKGHAVRTGVVNARGDKVLFADADGATPISEVVRLESALEGGAAVAIGSRAKRDDQTVVAARFYRRVIGRVFHGLVRHLVMVGDIRDTQCGFKMFPNPVAQDLFSCIRIDGFSFDVELLTVARRRGYTVAEVPVNWEHKPGSKVSLFRDSLRMARDLLVIRAHALRGDYERPLVAVMSSATERQDGARVVGLAED